MPEVKLKLPVKAAYLASWPDDPPPGAFTLSHNSSGTLSSIIYCCPCGCGGQGSLGIRPLCAIPKKSWEFNGDVDRPTLTPSVHHVGHWHGRLRDGVWSDA